MCEIIEQYGQERELRGEKQGISSEKRETVIRLLKAGYSVELASFASGMPEADVLDIQRKLLN